ncbi:MAG: ADP compounds hydrolase NudE [Gammaproteobacteria bacterium]|nr:ADP compounds hydrolase NudE [Gammaproteobacteria bacterium]NKB63985.1 ADP compounds hydrolase NudE [Gammaproteobacteria bacterium]
MKQKPEIRSVTTIAKGQLLAIEGVELQFPNGKSATFERIATAGPAVMVVPITDEGLLMVHEYAVGTDRYELGFVKGRIDFGESPEAAALRELKEEVGLGANELTYVREMHGVPHYSDFRMHLFFARDFYPEKLQGDEIEPLAQSNWRFDEIDDLLYHHQINDPRVLLALCLVKKWLKD